MSKRTQSIRSMFSGQGSDNKTDPGEVRRTSLPRVTSGAVRSLKDTFSDVEKEYEALKAKLADGQVAISLDPSVIDPSPLADRFAEQDEESFEALKNSIRERGQEIPVLVRPHPRDVGRYQSAYGHRRIRAARELGIPVRALVRELSDEDLVVAQGLENSAREDLSFVERSFFAYRLEEAGFDRNLIQMALSVDRAEVSKLIAVAKVIPEDFVQAIGRAPKIGRGRWQSFAEALSHDGAVTRVGAMITRPGFVAKGSDERFLAALSAANKTPVEDLSKRALMRLKNRTGDEIGTVSVTDKQWRFAIKLAEHEGFADYLANRIPELFETYEAMKAGNEADEA